MDAESLPETPYPTKPQVTASAPVTVTAAPQPQPSPVVGVPPSPASTPATDSDKPELVYSTNPLTGFPIVERPDAEDATVTLTHLGPAYEVTDGMSGKVFTQGTPKRVTQADADRLQSAHPYERWQIGEPESAEA